jgi:putative transposase
VILDLFSRAVVGWALDASLSTGLPRKALDMAIQRRRPAKGLLHHSDRGCQYTSAEYREQLRDKAVAESFFATLKKELLHRRSWSNRLDLRTALFDYIEVFYNRRRIHSSIAYRTPAEVENDYALATAA